MRHSFFSALLAVGGSNILVSAATLPIPSAPALPLSAFPPNPFVKPLSLDEVQHTTFYKNDSQTNNAPEVHSLMAAAATCTNPRVRYDWDTASTGTRQAFVNGIKCLMQRPASGIFPNAKNRYEDLVALHQHYTPNVHGNAKFLIWHRYYVWTFEDILRTECGFNNDLPWFDETKYAGKFGQSSIFSNTWLGAFATGGNCVTNGQFAGITLNVGPGTGNQAHCLARNGDEGKTANTNANMVNGCNARTDYADMAACAEGGAHAWGHNGIGAVMQDVYASPGDPTFWLHHMFIDRNYRIWQNGNPSRVTASGIDGNDGGGNRLTLDTWVHMNNIRPSVQIRDIINTLDGKLCYKYNY